MFGSTDTPTAARAAFRAWVARAANRSFLAIALLAGICGPAAHRCSAATLLVLNGQRYGWRRLMRYSYHGLVRRADVFAKHLHPPAGGKWPAVEVTLWAFRDNSATIAVKAGTPARAAARLLIRPTVQSAVDSLLAREAVRELGAIYHFPYRKYFHVRRLAAWNLADARAFDWFDQLRFRQMSQGWGRGETRGWIKKTNPNFPADLLESPYITGGRAFIGPIEFRLAPPWIFRNERRGRVAPWFAWCRAEIAEQYIMRRAIALHLRRYQRSVARQLGTSGFFTIQGATPADFGLLRLIIGHVSGPGLRVDMRALSAFERSAYMLGSPTRILPGYGGNYGYFDDLTGIKPRHSGPVGAIGVAPRDAKGNGTKRRRIRPLAFIPLKSRSHGFLYVFTKTPRISPSLVALNMSTFAWDVGENHVLWPICKRVISKTRLVAKWLRMPTMKQLMVCSCPDTGVPPTNQFGFPLPQLVRRRYRNVSWDQETK